MDIVRKKYKKGLMTSAEYRTQVIDSTVGILKNSDFESFKLLGKGTFGSVIELKHAPLGQTYAAKIVLKEHASIGEIKHWKSLRHTNILPLVASQYFKSSFSYVFLMPKYSFALDEKLNSFRFRKDKKSVEKSVSWLKGVIEGLRYMHSRAFCHLDVKCNNVLISADDSSAVLCYFGFVTRAKEGPVNIYGSPFIFRPPEAHNGRDWDDEKSELVPVDPYKLDVWTTGLLAPEIFTKMKFSRTPRKWDNPQWPKEIYKTLFKILQVKNFKKLLKVSFSMYDISGNGTMVILNLIIGSLQLNPRQRPAINDLVLLNTLC